MEHCNKLFQVFFLTVLMVSCNRSADKKPDYSEFRNPPAENAVHTWWHWMENAITKEGITKDLEAMREQGILTATILNVSLFEEPDLGTPKILFDTNEWYGMFEWALSEADRLGMTIGVHNCDGWSTSGGPWINPANSMKQCVWTKTYIKGGRSVEVELPEPYGRRGFYRDIRTIAFPATKNENSFRIAQPSVRINSEPGNNILYDANPFSSIRISNSTVIDLVFKEKFHVSRIAVHPRVRFDFVSLRSIRFGFELQSSSDGNNFKTVQRFEGPSMNVTSLVETKPVNERFYRIVFSDVRGSNKLELGELELLNDSDMPSYQTSIPFHLEKTVTTMAHSIRDYRSPGTDASGAVPITDITDLSGKMDENGVLRWDAPAGDWEILRIGYTTTGAVNFPATRAGTGLECDKMDTAALNIHFKNFPAKLISHAGKYRGNVFGYIFVDSWECEFQNWTGNFESEFEKRRDYDITAWLPVICGLTVESPEATERFLHDYQQTIAELIEENYYRHFDRLCRQNDLDLHAEVIYGGTTYPPLDVLKSNSYAKVPMYEFWARADEETELVTYTPGADPAYPVPVMAGALYGKKVIPAEAYTGYAHFSESPWDLKLYGDRAYCSGINQMVLHSYVHQPFDKKPGITLWEFGHSFNRHNPWWDLSSQWFTYQARVQNILQKGVPHADILYYTGDRYYPARDTGPVYELPSGYRMQKCNLDVLMNHCRVKDGKLLLDNGMSYEMLLLHDDVYMNYKTLRRISELVSEGAIIAGPRPVKVPGIDILGNEKLLTELSSEMWGNALNDSLPNKYGAGLVYSGKKIADILSDLDLLPDFSYETDGQAILMHIHKKIDNADVFFVVNQADTIIESECSFRVEGKSPEIWNPQYGTRYLPSAVNVADRITHVKYRFQPRESVFFIFGEKPDSELEKAREYENEYSPEFAEGTVSFEGIPGKIPGFTGFSSWTDSDDSDIKYYSGTAKYTLKFDLPPGIAGRKPLFLDPGRAGSAFEIMLNGNPAGTSTFPYHNFDVTELVREKENILEIRIANPHRNRIIGDIIQYGSLRDLWTTLPARRLPGKEKQLIESGWLGPLVFRY